ncbi:MAG: hypothetical protein WC758_08470 [Candidatus Woesearchaeota archaeon]|jgi:hypothetical protein
MEKQLIVKVWLKNINHQKMLTIPSKSEIQAGDYVSITKVESPKPKDLNTLNTTK